MILVTFSQLVRRVLWRAELLEVELADTSGVNGKALEQDLCQDTSSRRISGRPDDPSKHDHLPLLLMFTPDSWIRRGIAYS